MHEPAKKAGGASILLLAVVLATKLVLLSSLGVERLLRCKMLRLLLRMGMERSGEGCV